MSEDENKAIRVISFDDKTKNYKIWAKKFLLAATLRGYNIVLTKKDPKVPKHDLVPKDTEAEKRKLKLRKKLWAEYAQTAIDLDVVLIQEKNNKNNYKIMFGKNLAFLKHSR